MDYKTELELADAGFILTPNIWHSGKGQGKVFEKIVDNMRVYFGVDVDDTVVKLDFTNGAPVVSQDDQSLEKASEVVSESAEEASKESEKIAEEPSSESTE